jgi:hypothetical protein
MSHGNRRRISRERSDGVKLWQKFLHGIHQAELAGIAQFHDRERGEALRHRRDPETRVGGRGNFFLHIREAVAAGVHEFSVEHDAPHEAGRTALRREIDKELVDLRESPPNFALAIKFRE